MTSSSPNIQQKICLVTVCTKNYWAGTRVMIKSFKKQNKWFKGDVIIISDDDNIKKSAAKKINAKLLNPSSDLTQKINTLCHILPIYTKLKSQFYLFEVFRLVDYQHVIFADSDLLFIKNINEKSLINEHISAVLDPSHYRGFKRDKSTFEKIAKTVINNPYCFNQFFNTGFIYIPKSYMTLKNYNALLTKINYKFLKNNPDLLTDESIFNHVFEGTITSLSLSYNCPVHLIIEGHADKNVAVIHFTGKNKPWRLASWLILPLRTKGYLRYLLLWLKASFTF